MTELYATEIPLEELNVVPFPENPIQTIRIYEGPVGFNGYYVEQFLLNEEMVLEKSITLSNAPTHPNRTLVFVDGAGPTFIGLDFFVIGNRVSWDLMRLDGVLDANDRLQVVYF
jgi:hypothetical protein